MAANNATYTVTMNGKDITYTADASATVAEITAGLVALLTASTVPEEFQEVTFADAATHVTATANTPGKPFTQTSSSSAGSLTTATATANKSPNDVNDADNWSDGVPDAADDVIIEDTDSSLLYNLDALAAIALTSLRIKKTFTGNIGLPQDTGLYDEYRPQYWQILATTVKIGEGLGSGSGRIKLNLGATAAAITVYDSGQSADAGLPAILLCGTSASNTLEVYGGASVGVALLAGETSNLSGGVIVAENAQVRCSSGVTLATTTVGGAGAKLTTEGAIATAIITALGGVHELLDGNVTTGLYVNGGRAEYLGNDTITLLETRDEGVIDFSRDGTARTVTNANFYGGHYEDPFESVTFSNAARVHSLKWTFNRGNAYGIQFSA